MNAARMDKDMKDKVISILHSLKDLKLNNSMHTLEKETAVYFNLKYMEELCMAGDWLELEQYIASFTKSDDSPEIFVLILGNLQRDAAKHADERLYKELLKDRFPESSLIPLEERKRIISERYGDTHTLRKDSLDRLMELIKLDPKLSTYFAPPPPAPVATAILPVATGILPASLPAPTVVNANDTAIKRKRRSPTPPDPPVGPPIPAAKKKLRRPWLSVPATATAPAATATAPKKRAWR